MNIILIVSDTLRRDHLGCYGNKWISTPNIDKFATGSFVFEDAYIASFPTVPNRRDLFTGRFTFTYADWSPLTSEEVVLSEILGKAEYRTMFIADTPHTTAPGYNYQRGFSGWLKIRGQEGDPLVTHPHDIELPCSPKKLRNPDTVKQMMRNNLLRRSEEDYFCAQTMREAEKWLEKNYKEKFFLYIDTFDPHEPWDPPDYYVDLYDKNYQGEEVIYPVYGPCDYLSPEELKHIRAHYAGEVTLVDRWVGKLLRKIEDLGLLENSAVILTTDHGFYHGEHGLIGKSIITEKYQGLAPLYEEVTHIPLIIHLPQAKPCLISGFVQPPDLTATIIELTKAEDSGLIEGKSLLPLIKKETSKVRNFTLSSPAIIHGSAGGQRITLTSKDWVFIHGLEAGKEKEYETRIVDGKVRLQKRLGKKVEPELYHLASDPGQEKNVFFEHEDVAKKLHRQLIAFLESVNTKEEYLKPWRAFKGGE